MRVQNNAYPSALQIQDQFLNKRSVSEKPTLTEKELSFQNILKQKTDAARRGNELKFSKHAAGRLQDRNIELTDEQMSRLSDGTQKADAKGIKESLVLIDRLAFIVNIPNRMVVTAMDQTETDENIFTNIDGAVIM